MSCNEEIGVVDLQALPIDNLESLPDEILAIREIVEQDGSGNVSHVFVRVPATKLFPSAANANLFTLETNNPMLTVEEAQPLPAYVSNEGNQLVVMPAKGNRKAQFMVIAVEDGIALCQSNGVLNTLGGNRYNAGSKYYLATEGGVTTDPSQTGQVLFTCLGKTKLLINIGA